MDNKELAKSIRSDLSKVIAAVDKLSIEINKLTNASIEQNKITDEKIVHVLRNSPRQDDIEPIDPQQHSNKQTEPSPRKYSFSYGSTADTTNKAKTCGDDAKPWWRRMWAWKPWKRIIVIVGGLVGIAYAVITYRQWDDSHRNFAFEERSWVKASVTWPQDLTNPVAVVRLDNVGKTPALGYKGDLVFEIVDSQRGPSLSYLGRHTTGFAAILFPGDHQDLQVILSGNSVGTTDKQLKGLSDGSLYVALFGQIVFRDQFDEHWMRFCRWSTYALGPEHRSVSAKAESCVAYNSVGDGKPPN